MDVTTRLKLKGITWNHTRGLVPMVATAQRYCELHPSIEIEWNVRSLQEFADEPLKHLVDQFDLLIIDHPWVGHVAETGILVPLDSHLSKGYLEDQAANSVGLSYPSYEFDNHQWALPVDAASPVASSRPDLLEGAGADLPQTLEELLDLADKGLVAFPVIPIDTLMNFYMFCLAFGEEPFLTEEQVVSKEVGINALRVLKKLADKIDPTCFERNPIKIYEAMTRGDEIAYCPFAYGYINYARRNYDRSRLQFHDLVTVKGGKPLRSTLGGRDWLSRPGAGVRWLWMVVGVINQAVHTVVLMLWLCGEVQYLQAYKGTLTHQNMVGEDNASLTTYSPYEGMEIAFNGFEGRIDAWHGIPWREQEKVNQAKLHEQEMSQEEREKATNYEEIMVMDNFSGQHEQIKVFQDSGGYGGGDVRLQNQIFRDPNMADPLELAAGSREGSMSILIGIAARKSIESGEPVRIEDLVSLQPHPTRGA